MNRSICVLVSGGLDSDVLLAKMSQDYSTVVPLYVRQGLAWESVELYWLKRYVNALHNRRIKPVRILDLPMNDVYGKHWSLGDRAVPGARTRDEAVYLPGRNLALTLKAAVLCAMSGIQEMALGSLDHNPFPDATPHFFKMWSRALSRGLGKPIHIRAPFRTSSKVEVIKQGRGLPLELSFSCIDSVGKHHCGRCNKCAERKKAFRMAGVTDKTVYAKN